MGTPRRAWDPVRQSASPSAEHALNVHMHHSWAELPMQETVPGTPDPQTQRQQNKAGQISELQSLMHGMRAPGLTPTMPHSPLGGTSSTPHSEAEPLPRFCRHQDNTTFQVITTCRLAQRAPQTLPLSATPALRLAHTHSRAGAGWCIQRHWGEGAAWLHSPPIQSTRLL